MDVGITVPIIAALDLHSIRNAAFSAEGDSADKDTSITSKFPSGLSDVTTIFWSRFRFSTNL